MLPMVVTSVAASSGGIDDEAGLLSRSGIPPVHRRALSRTQIQALAAAEACLERMRLDEGARRDMGVLVGTCFANGRQRRNAMRVAASRHRLQEAQAHGIDPLRTMATLLQEFDASIQDRIGEMASSIPSRIAIAHGLHGRAASLESAEATSCTALWHAVNSLATGATAHELVVLAQEEPPQELVQRWARRRGGDAGLASSGYWDEGAVAVALTTPDRAQRCALPTLAVVLGAGLTHTGRRGVFRGPRRDNLGQIVTDLLVRVCPVPVEQVRQVVLPPWEVDLGEELQRSFPEAVIAMPAAGGPMIVQDQITELPGDPGDVAVCLETSLTGTIGALVLGRAPSTTEALPPPPRQRRVDIVGKGARFGGGADLEDYRRLAMSVETALSPLGTDILPGELFRPGPPTAGFSYCSHGSPLTGTINPPATCVLPPRRWSALDPAQRLALQVADSALSGARELLGGRGAVVVGTTLGPTSRRTETPDDTMTLDAEFASAVAALVSNELGLNAIPIAVEAACASSLAALDIAFRAIQNDQLDYALVGGVELPCNTRDLVLCSALGMLSPTVTAPFSSRADGLTPGDGCGFVVIAAEPCPMAAGRRVSLVSIGTSCDAASMLAPSVTGQTLAMGRALTSGSVDPASVQLVEAHGTGTVRGDGTELEAIAECYLSGRRHAALRVASVKGLVGHTFAAAGMAGLMRACFAIEDGVFPATPGADPSTSPQLLVLPTSPDAWPPEMRRRAAVSSFGTGGINYHVILEEEKV